MRGSGIGVSHRLVRPQTTHRVGAKTGTASGTGSLSDGEGGGEVWSITRRRKRSR